MIHCLAGHAGHASRAGRISCSGSAGYVTRAVCVVSAITIIVNQLITNCLNQEPTPTPPRRGFIQYNLRYSLIIRDLQDLAELDYVVSLLSLHDLQDRRTATEGSKT